MDIKAPAFPESIHEGTVAAWHKQPGEGVRRDEVIADIETDKVVLEIVAPEDGVLTSIVKPEGETVLSEDTIAVFEPGAASTDAAPAAAEPAAGTPAAGTPAAGTPAAGTPAAGAPAPAEPAAPAGDVVASPAARKLADERGINLAAISGTGKDGRITKEDVAGYEPPTQPPAVVTEPPPPPPTGDRPERRVTMTRLRATMATRLVDAQQNAAMLTTFNEVNMRPIMELRKKYQDDFQRVHEGTRLGFMSFFVRASCEALKRFPAVNAFIDGNEIVYHGYQDIGVAVSTDRGLVVPVLRDADRMNLAEIERKIADYGTRARDNKLAIEDMMGGTFTISNGGIFGSLLSTPILNPPQTAILGMHKIQERPMAVDGEVVIEPMMYLALSYDHRMIDGQEAVRFLVTIKELLEEPARMLLDI